MRPLNAHARGTPRAPTWRLWTAAAACAGLLLVLIGCGSQGLSTLEDPDASWSSQSAYVTQRQENRLYEGAPPTVPHSIADLGRDDCLSCHLEGTAVDPETNRPAPVTPHPEQMNCRQCHVEQVETTEFKSNSVAGLKPQPAPEGLHALTPPYIPHRLQDREDCQSCHLSPLSPDVLVPGHGVRTNCTQCHVQLAQAAAPFEPTHKTGEEN